MESGASYWLDEYIDLFRAILNCTTNSALTANQYSHLCCTDTASEAGLTLWAREDEPALAIRFQRIGLVPGPAGKQIGVSSDQALRLRLRRGEP